MVETFIPIGTILHPYMDRDVVTFLPEDIKSMEYEIRFNDYIYFCFKNDITNTPIKNRSTVEKYNIDLNGDVSISIAAIAPSKSFNKSFKCKKEDVIKLYKGIYDILKNPYAYKEMYCDDTSRSLIINLNNDSTYFIDCPCTINDSDTNTLIFDFLCKYEDINEFCIESRKKLFSVDR